MKHIGLAILFGLMAVGLMGAVIAPSSAQANTPLVVNSTVDEVDATPGDGLCVSTPSGQCTLRAAIMEANALAGADTISLPAGIYTLTIAGNNENTGATGDLDVRSDLNLHGASTDDTIVDGNAIDRVIHLVTSNNLEMSDLTIRNGYWKPPLATTGGGGLMVDYYTAVVTITRVAFTNNIAWGCGGVNNYGNLLLASSLISGNVTANFGGGGMCNGGIANLVETSIISNTTGGGGAAGVDNYDTGIMTIANGRIESNKGDGVFNRGVLTITTTSVISQSYGGISQGCTGCPNTKLYVINSTISDNGSGTGGGGVYVNDGTVGIYNSTIVSNVLPSSFYAGLRVVSGTVTLQNTLVANSVGGNECVQAGGVLIDGGHNLIEDNTCGFTGGADPLVGPLQDNGGPTLTHALLPGSPAIDAGDPAGCKDALGNLLVGDQRGFIRAADGDSNGSVLCDIGAFEYGSIPFLQLFLPLILR